MASAPMKDLENNDKKMAVTQTEDMGVSDEVAMHCTHTGPTHIFLAV